MIQNLENYIKLDDWFIIYILMGNNIPKDASFQY